MHPVDWTIFSIRRIIVSVFPEPAPATTSRGLSTEESTVFCWPRLSLDGMVTGGGGGRGSKARGAQHALVCGVRPLAGKPWGEGEGEQGERSGLAGKRACGCCVEFVGVECWC